MATGLPIVDDYGPIGRGASAARYVLASNGSEYLIKGPNLTPAHRNVAANEFVAVRLADLVGLPVLDHRILEMEGQLFFGSGWMQQASFYPQITEDLFKRCHNRQQAYELVVFDSWICNVDRHQENLVVRHIHGKAGSGDRHLLLLNDHSHCLIQPGQAPNDLKRLLASTPANYIRLDFVKTAITEPAKVRRAIDKMLAVESEDIKGLTQSIPDEFLPDGGREIIEEFLFERRSRLRTLFRNARATFSNLGVGDL
jgi:hypothetical protein